MIGSPTHNFVLLHQPAQLNPAALMPNLNLHAFLTFSAVHQDTQGSEVMAYGCHPPLASEIMPEISHLQLLRAINPHFLFDIQWRCNGSIHEKKTLRQWGSLLKLNLVEILLYTSGNLDNQQNEVGQLEHLEYVLQDLENLLSERILKKIPNQHTPGNNFAEQVTTTGVSLRKAFPKLTRLSLLENNPSDFQSFLHLNQEPHKFKRTFSSAKCLATELLAKRMNGTQNENLKTSKPVPETSSVSARTTLSDSRFWRCSTHLFNALELHLKPCSKRKPTMKHQALLHLKGSLESEEPDPHPRLDMLLASCSDPKRWPEVHCTVSDLEATSRRSCAPGHTELITDICQDAGKYDDCNRIVKINVRGNELIDLSTLDENDILEQSGANPSKSLSCLIEGNFMNNPYRFTQKSKRHLAFNLAWSLLQLYEGPWIQTNWTSDSLFFMFGAEKATYRLYNIHQPYIKCSLTSDPKYESDISDPLHKHPLILCFGRVLMEIEKGEIINVTEKTKGGAPDLLKTLQNHLKTWKEELNADYVSAINACLKFQKLPRKDDSTDSFRTVFLDNVVAPLEREMNRFSQTRFGSWDLEWESKTLMVAPVEASTVQPTPRPIHPKSSMSLSSETTLDVPSIPFLPPAEWHGGPGPRMPSSRGVAMFSDYDGPPLENKQRTAEAFLKKLQDFRERHIHRLPESMRVKIAVLDTGLQAGDMTIRGRRSKIKRDRRTEDKKSRDPIQGTMNFTEHPDHDEDGHGTGVVGLLLTVAPEADIYVGKISGGKTVGITDQQISKALRWAVNDVKADIISMSFGLDNDRDWNEEMQEAIDNACSAKTVLFAAASNYGGNRRRTYPAKANAVFCIHATDGNGNPSDQDPTPLRNEDNFTTLGVSVPCGSDTNQPTFKTGTSYAVPIAAGIAANIMDLGDWLHDRGELDIGERRKLRAYEGMRNVFRKMAEARRDYDYVAPWHLWDGNTDERTVWGIIRASL